MRSKEAIEAMQDLGFSTSHAEVYVRAKGRCEYCGVDLIRDRMAYAGIEIDHIVPQSVGGLDDASNLALSCKVCNSVKSSFDPRISSAEDNRNVMISNARRYIVEKVAEHDRLWLRVNGVLRETWWEPCT